MDGDGEILFISQADFFPSPASLPRLPNTERRLYLPFELFFYVFS
jgi:hypothetical protein